MNVILLFVILLFVILLNVIHLDVIHLNVIHLNVIHLNVIHLNVFLPNVFLINVILSNDILPNIILPIFILLNVTLLNITLYIVMLLNVILLKVILMHFIFFIVILLKTLFSVIFIPPNVTTFSVIMHIVVAPHSRGQTSSNLYYVCPFFPKFLRKLFATEFFFLSRQTFTKERIKLDSFPFLFEPQKPFPSGINVLKLVCSKKARSFPGKLV